MVVAFTGLDGAGGEMGRRLLIAVLLFIGAAMAQGVYKWVDEQGRTVYSDKPPAGKSARQIEVPAQPGPQAAEVDPHERQKLKEKRERRGLQEVLGTVSLAFTAHAAASLPEPPFKLKVVVRSVERATVSKFDVTDSSPEWKRDARAVLNHQDFALPLEPGSYELTAIEVEAPGLSDSPLSFPLRARHFAVPAGNCIYIGRVYFAFQRLPPLPLDLMTQLARKMADEEGEKGLALHYLPSGALVYRESGVDSPGAMAAWHRAEGGEQALARAREIGCVIRLAGS